MMNIVDDKFNILSSNPDVRILQWVSELKAFTNFMIANDVKSYLEIGIKSGQLVIFMKDVLEIDEIYGCDIVDTAKYGIELKEHGINFFCGDSNSKEYLNWRKELKHIDMVLIDGDHSKKGIESDYMRELSLPHKFIAIHDSSGIKAVRRFWSEKVGGRKIEFVNADPAADFLYLSHKKGKPHCGIGITCHPSIDTNLDFDVTGTTLDLDFDITGTILDKVLYEN